MLKACCMLVFFRFWRKVFKELYTMENINPIDFLQVEINLVDAEEEKLQMELKDVLTDIETPTTSEDEDEDDDEVVEEQNEIVRQLKNSILCALAFPTRYCDYVLRYEVLILSTIYNRLFTHKVILK